MSNRQNFLIVITGPTAIGKTKVAVETALHFQTEIISADSRQIFRELTIGTAVPDPSELAAVKHHFIHSHSVSDTYNASRYETEVLGLLEKLFEQYPVVVMAGGSMLYIDAVCNGIDVMPDILPEVRDDLKKQLKEEGIESLRLQLKNCDPEYYGRVDLKNPARIMHALEVYVMTGKPYSSFRTSPQKERNFSVIKIGLNCDREKLHNRINARVDQMIEAGLEEEAHSVYHLSHLQSLNTVGYREFYSYFKGEIPKDKAIELIKRNTRRYARKQLTWFRNDQKMKWFTPGDISGVIDYAENVIHKSLSNID
jgi:tRNA dimethylallyltransferase